MLKKFILTSFVLLTVTLAFHAQAASARSYALIEQSSGRLISGQNIDERLSMASTTKIMTALIACESGKLDETFTVPAEAICVEGSSMGLVADEKITLRELCYGLMLESGNDAANAIAMCLGDTLPGFTAMMNNKAEQLSLKNTQFENPSGLDADGHYTTALDLARLGAEAMNNADFKQIAGTKKISVSYNGSKNGRWLYNHNRLLGSYEGELGIKTGFTKKSGRCLVSCACRDGVTLVFATLDDPDDWDDHEQLLDYGFKILSSRNVMFDEPKFVAQIVGGKSDSAEVAFNTQVMAAVSDSELLSVKQRVDMPKFFYAPLKKGQKLGEIVFMLDNTVIARTDIVCTQDVGLVPRKPSAIVSFFNTIGNFFKSIFT